MKRFCVILLCSLICCIIGLNVQDVWAKKPFKFKPNPNKVGTVPRLSHSGDITGLVEDCSSEAGVEGALVHIPGLSIMAKTDSQGMFRLLLRTSEAMKAASFHPP